MVSPQYYFTDKLFLNKAIYIVLQLYFDCPQPLFCRLPFRTQSYDALTNRNLQAAYAAVNYVQGWLSFWFHF